MNSVRSNFGCPIYRNVSPPANLNRQLREYILSEEKPANRHQNSPQQMPAAVFESEFDLLYRRVPCLNAFRDFVFSRLMGFLTSITPLKQQQLARLKVHHHAWFHITRTNGFVRAHTHPLASWSMIYCVQPGDETPENDDMAGHLVFNDPRGNASMFLDPTNRQMLREFSFNALRIRLKPGELLFFPSYLQHSVEPYQGQLPRITIAANFWFQTSG